MNQDAVRDRIQALGPWFHNMTLGGVQTAPDHFLGDYPMVKWQRFEDAIPVDLSEMSVLDIGCNAGFYSIQMKRRGAARVLGIDFDEDYLRQAGLRRRLRGWRSSTDSYLCTMWVHWLSASTSCCSWACCTICDILCWRWI